MQVLASHCYSLVVAHLPVVQIEERHPSGRVDVPHALLPVVPSAVGDLLPLEAFQVASLGREKKLPGTIHAQTVLEICLQESWAERELGGWMGCFHESIDFGRGCHGIGDHSGPLNK